MSKKPDVRYENNYRFTPEEIKRKSRRLYITWAITAVGGIVAAFIFFGIVGSIYDPEDDGLMLPVWANIIGIALLLLGIVIAPLLYAAWMGGRAIHRWGPLGTMTAIVGLFLAATSGDFGPGWVYLGIGLMAFGVIIIYYLAMIENVPVWLQLPIFRSPRLYINKPETKKKKK
jgi:hypothetical protein